MPGTDQELIALTNGLVTSRISLGDVDSIVWADGTAMTRDEWRLVLNMTEYIGRCQRKPPGQRKAMRLLRSLLTPEQRRTLRAGRYFYVTTRRGTVFRFLPRSGSTERVERHGSRYFTKSQFCLHDEEGMDKMPPADVIVAHLLLIVADEDRFLEIANERATESQLWNGEYLRRMRRRHQEVGVAS